MFEYDVLFEGYLPAVHSLCQRALLLISPGIDNANENSVYLLYK